MCLPSAVQQRGAATLIVAIVLLLALTLATFSAARIGVSEQRSVANEIRAKQAFWVAQAGLEQGIAFFNANKALVASGSVIVDDPPRTEAGWMHKDSRRWMACGNTDRTTPCGDGSQPHGIRWGRYDRLGADDAGVNYAIPLVGVFPDYFNNYNVDIDALAREGDANIPSVNTSLIVTATVNRVGADVLRGMSAISVSQVLKGYDSMVARPIAPLMVAGTVNLTGASISIWANPGNTGAPNPNIPDPDISTAAANANFVGAANPDELGSYNPGGGGGPIDPLSIWSRGTTTLGASSGTCLPQSQEEMNTSQSPIQHPSFSRTPMSPLSCMGGGAMSVSFIGGGDDDIVECVRHPLDTNAPPGCPPLSSNTVPPAFPPDLFYYMFGVASDKFQRIKNDATVLANCDNLGAVPSGLYWVTGDCTIPPGTTTIGGVGATAPPSGGTFRATAPITLIVDGGTLTLPAGIHFWGTVYLRNSLLDLPAAGVAPVLHGALLSDGDLTVNDGSLNLVYDTRAFTASSARAGGFAKVLGGWQDRLQ